MNPQRNELSIQEFIDLEFDKTFFPVTNRLQKMLPETLSSGSINEQLAEFIATMIYNLEASLVNTKEALLRTRVRAASKSDDWLAGVGEGVSAGVGARLLVDLGGCRGPVSLM